MMRPLFAIGLLLTLPFAAHAQTFNLNVSPDDALVIGRALDKLLGTDPVDRTYTDRSNLYGRLQQQITTQGNAMAKAKADADKAAADKAIADAVKAAEEKAKAESAKPEGESHE